MLLIAIFHSVALKRFQQKTCLWENNEKIWLYKRKDKEHFGIFIFVPSNLPSLWKWIKIQQKSAFLVKKQNIISLGNIARDNWGYLYKKYIIYDEFYRNSHLKKTQFVSKCVLMSTTAGNIFFVEYWLSEHISMRERGEKVEISNFTHGMSLFSSKPFSLFFT